MEKTELFLKLLASDDDDDQVLAAELFEKRILKELEIDRKGSYCIGKLCYKVGKKLHHLPQQAFEILFDKIYK